MQVTLIIAAVLHVLSGVFWAGTTFALPRMAGNNTDQFLKPQIGAAAVAIATGALLWFLLHRRSSGTQEHILGLGANFALLAASVQVAAGLNFSRKHSILEEPDASKLRDRVATGQRVAAGLLVVTVTCMAAARYV